LEDIENTPFTTIPRHNVPATSIPPSDASTTSDNNNQTDAPPVLFSPVPTLQSHVAKRMVWELQPHLMDPIENQNPVDNDALTQEIGNVRVTRSRKGNTDLEDSHAAMTYLTMCDKFDDFSEFALIASYGKM